MSSLFLVADTSGRDGSIGLAQGEEDGSCALVESVVLAGGAFSSQLVPHIATLLSSRGFNKSDLQAFVVISGPGSFTGLRVGLAAIKAMAAVLGKPIAVVSALEALAAAEASLEGPVIALIRAGRGQVYVGQYYLSPGTRGSTKVRRIKEVIALEGDLASMVHSARVVTSDVLLAGLLNQHGMAVQVIAPSPLDKIAKVGWAKILAGEVTSPENLDANYISRLDLEIASTANAKLAEPLGK